MADIFISYARADRARCDAVYEVLSHEGYSVAVDHECIEAGQPFRTRIEHEIDAATVVIALLSAASCKRDFVLDELDRAKRLEKVLLPLIIDDTPDGQVLGYGQLQALRCQWLGQRLAPNSREALLTDLKRHIRPVGPRGAAVREAAIEQLRTEVDRRLGDAYTVEERIGTGRMSIVYKAQHNVLGKTVALKVAPLSGILLLPGFYAEFRGALETARALSHANILQIHDFKLLETIACGIVEYVDGESLEQRMLKAGGPLELRLIKDLACQIAEALAHAHSRGIVHCRLTPSSVLIARSDDRVFVTGFGMPNVGSGPEAAAVRALFMDATYESPEQCIGEVPSPQSDQYALGAVLYEMLTGRPPFRGKTAYTVLKQQCEAAPLPISALRPDCPPAIEATVMRLLSKHPHDRFLATRELLLDMHDWPLPEPAGSRDRISASSLETRAAKTALASFERSLHEEPLLLVHFYRRLCADPSFAQLFERTNFDRQIDMLRKGVRHLLEYGLGDENTRRELERVATQHKNLAMSERQLHGFVDVLVTLLLEYDPHATDPAERELLRRDWHNTIELGLTPFLEVARACVSSVPVAAQ